jgi:hypothetical protein
MFKISGLLTLAITFAFGAILFWTSQSVQDVERQLAQKKSIVAQEKETIRVLSTEWDYLNRPQRLERLATEGVGMDEVESDEIGIVSDVSLIPEPVVPVLPSIKPASLSRIAPAASGDDDVSIQYDRGSFETLLESVGGGE